MAFSSTVLETQTVLEERATPWGEAPRLIVAFPHLRPRLVELERCYRGVRGVLWGEEEADAGAGDAVT